jgi:hypothetical protein
VISIDGLHAFADRLSRLDIGHAEADALEQAARDLEASVKAVASPPADEGATSRRGHRTAVSAAISHRIDDHSAIIGAVGFVAVTRELGSATRPPDPVLSAAARQSGPAIAERIGQIFAQLVSGMRND